MIGFFKNKARHNAIDKARKKLKRNMSFRNLETIKSVGIIIRYQFEIGDTAINKLIDFFKKKNTSLEILVYYPDKKLPANVNFSEDTLLFTEGDTNWFGKPNKKEIENFINTDFGLLIDLLPQYVYSLQYIVESSKASFKIGRISYDNAPYDFILLGDENNDRKYVDELFNYLGKIER